MSSVYAKTKVEFHITLTKEEADTLYTLLYQGTSSTAMEDLGLYDFMTELHDAGADKDMTFDFAQVAIFSKKDNEVE